MARPKTAIDVELGRIRADVERARLKNQTVTYCTLIGGVVLMFGMAA